MYSEEQIKEFMSELQLAGMANEEIDFNEFKPQVVNVFGREEQVTRLYTSMQEVGIVDQGADFDDFRTLANDVLPPGKPADDTRR